MKTIDNIDIATKYLKRHRMMSFNVVISILLTIISILSLLTLSIYFNLGIKKAMNKYSNVSTISFGSVENIDENKLICDEICFKEIWLNYSKNGTMFDYPTITIDGVDRTYDYDDSVHKVHYFDRILAYSNDSKFYLPSEEEYLKKQRYGNVILAGSDNISNNEILISSIVLDYFGLDYNTVIGKKISYKMKMTSTYKVYYNDNLIQDDYKDSNVYIIKDFIIKGVYNKNISHSISRQSIDGIYENIELTSIFWIKENQIYFPGADYNRQRRGYVYNKLPEVESKYAYDNGFVYAPYGFNLDDRYTYEKYRVSYQFKNVDNAYNYWKKEKSNSIIHPNIYLREYFDLYPSYEFGMKLLIVTTSLLFVVMVLNFIRTSSYFIDKNKQFLTMCKAIGMKFKDLRLLHILMNTISFIKAAIISFVVGIIVSIIMVFVFDNKLNTKDFKLKMFDKSVFWYFIPIYLLLILLVFITINIISLYSIKKIKKDTLLSNLNG